MVEYKIVRDPIHGNIRFEGLFLDLLETPEIQRLHGIKQLGFAYMVFPGANHTRLEHSLGAYKMASLAADSLSLPDEERELIECASLLHDLGHGPFSHTLECILRGRFGIDHVDITEKIIMGEEQIFEEGEREFVDAPKVAEVLDKYDIDKKEIVDLIRGRYRKKEYLSQILNSPIDVDQLDYLLRDGYYTGVAYGTVDVDRFFQILTILNNALAVERKGVSVVESIFMARELMYSSVYFHKTVRIAELMLSRAIEFVEDTEPFEFFRYNDGELFSILREKGEFQREMITRLKYRRLFKQAYVIGATEEERKRIEDMENPEKRTKKEREIESVLDIPEGHVIIDVPRRELFLSEPRIDKVDVLVKDNDRAKRIGDFTPITNAIKKRQIPDWYLMVVTDDKYKDKIEKNIEAIIFD